MIKGVVGIGQWLQLFILPSSRSCISQERHLKSALSPSLFRSTDSCVFSIHLLQRVYYAEI